MGRNVDQFFCPKEFVETWYLPLQRMGISVYLYASYSDPIASLGPLFSVGLEHDRGGMIVDGETKQFVSIHPLIAKQFLSRLQRSDDWSFFVPWYPDSREARFLRRVLSCTFLASGAYVTNRIPRLIEIYTFGAEKGWEEWGFESEAQATLGAISRVDRTADGTLRYGAWSIGYDRMQFIFGTSFDPMLLRYRSYLAFYDDRKWPGIRPKLTSSETLNEGLMKLGGVRAGANCRSRSCSLESERR